MSNKTISINPNLFSVNKAFTRKNNIKKKSTNIPIISPNSLKKKLLNRIKEHKQQQNNNFENKNKKLNDNLENNNTENKQDNLDNFNDEFSDSINYLQTLSKQRNIEKAKQNNENIKQHMKETLERKTMKNQTYDTTPMVNIDLPEELQIFHPTIQPNNIEDIQINKYPKNDVQYGILKGGTKPSYREWVKTQRNNIVTNPNSSIVIQGGTINTKNSLRENRLTQLKAKLKMKNQEALNNTFINKNLIKKPIDNNVLSLQPPIQQPIQPPIQQPIQQPIQPPIQQPIQPPIQQPIQQPIQPHEINRQNTDEIIGTKHITTKTIKKKYTLGKSLNKQSVGILIKDRGTRKQVLSAQKELKHKNLNDIKLYLRGHNLIKVGSYAPNDVLRKIYESTMLAGEITNINPDMLLHNLSKEDKEL